MTRQFLKLPASYITPSITRGVAISGQPETQYYFDRPISVLLGACFEAGYVVDGLEEPVFAPEDRASQSSASDVWHQIPPVLAVRLRLSAFT
ncbi:MAG: hypothetical protein HYX93_03395 [Chloroflexi bacterium]|nr:hypothetical protein [Chloroflexota bacterium]